MKSKYETEKGLYNKNAQMEQQTDAKKLQAMQASNESKEQKSPTRSRDPPSYLKATTAASSRQNDILKRKEQLEKRYDKDVAKNPRLFSADGRTPLKDSKPSLSAKK